MGTFCMSGRLDNGCIICYNKDNNAEEDERYDT